MLIDVVYFVWMLLFVFGVAQVVCFWFVEFGTSGTLCVVCV